MAPLEFPNRTRIYLYGETNFVHFENEMVYRSASLNRPAKFNFSISMNQISWYIMVAISLTNGSASFLTFKDGLLIPQTTITGFTYPGQSIELVSDARGLTCLTYYSAANTLKQECYNSTGNLTTIQPPFQCPSTCPNCTGIFNGLGVNCSKCSAPAKYNASGICMYAQCPADSFTMIGDTSTCVYTCPNPL